jgi:hypothetical protein
MDKNQKDLKNDVKNSTQDKDIKNKSTDQPSSSIRNSDNKKDDLKKQDDKKSSTTTKK